MAWSIVQQEEGQLTLLELQSRFGDTPLKFQVVCPKLSPKRDCSPKRVKMKNETHRSMFILVSNKEP